jgi:hypothetical protein
MLRNGSRTVRILYNSSSGDAVTTKGRRLKRDCASTNCTAATPSPLSIHNLHSRFLRLTVTKNRTLSSHRGLFSAVRERFNVHIHAWGNVRHWRLPQHSEKSNRLSLKGLIQNIRVKIYSLKEALKEAVLCPPRPQVQSADLLLEC